MIDKPTPPHQPRRTMDGFIRRPQTTPIRPPRQTATRQVRNVDIIPRRPPLGPQEVKPQVQKEQTKSIRIKTILSYTGIVLLAVSVGTALVNAQIGQWLVIAGGIVALILRADSRVIFGAALFCLVMIPLMTVFNQQALSENYALYAFILLAIGTIRAMIEAAGNKDKTSDPSHKRL